MASALKLKFTFVPDDASEVEGAPESFRVKHSLLNKKHATKHNKEKRNELRILGPKQNNTEPCNNLQTYQLSPPWDEMRSDDFGD